MRNGPGRDCWMAVGWPVVQVVSPSDHGLQHSQHKFRVVSPICKSLKIRSLPEKKTYCSNTTIETVAVIIDLIALFTELPPLLSVEKGIDPELNIITWSTYQNSLGWLKNGDQQLTSASELNLIYCGQGKAGSFQVC